MVPLIVLCGSFLVFQVLRRAGVRAFADWVTGLRWSLALMFLVTASAHFSHLRTDLVCMVPDWIPNPGFWVTFTGFAEIAGAIGLVVPRTSRPAAIGLTLLLLAVFPANVHAAQANVTIGGRPVTELGIRVLEQIGYVVAVLVAGFTRRAPVGLATVS
jgi:uncharacterized membrane protein